MIEIVLAVCLSAAPERCKEVAFPGTDGMSTPYQCVQQGELKAVEWLEAHPQWTVRRISCRRAGLEAKA